MIDFGASLPHVFQEPIGVDFPRALVRGMRQRFRSSNPLDMSRVTLIVNTTRMARRVSDIFAEGPAGFLPNILVLGDIEKLLTAALLPPARNPLSRRLQLAQLIKPLLENRPEFAPGSALFALSDSLARLMDEMQGEGVELDALQSLDVSNHSDYWANSLRFIEIAHHYIDAMSHELDAEARQRVLVTRLIAQWTEAPPSDPVILAGSTGSRGTTALLMDFVCKLDQGAVILPGFDTDMPDNVWRGFDSALQGEDHPQFRFARFLNRAGVGPREAEQWSDLVPHNSAGNACISLALRPAPVTDAWLTEGRDLGDLPTAMEHVTMLEAPSPRMEALAIAMRLRRAAEDGTKAALITPDRMLTRRVTAILDRWDIVPDDSGGLPLHLSPPGRFLRHVAELMLKPMDAELLLTLLKHPLTNSGDSKGNHGLLVQMLEDKLRRDRAPYPDAARLDKMIAEIADKTRLEEPSAWGKWLLSSFFEETVRSSAPLETAIGQLRHCAEKLARGTDSSGAGALWDAAPGRAALAAIESLEDVSDQSGTLLADDLPDLLLSILKDKEVRRPDDVHPDIMIWGTLEARVQGADLVILAGLTEGIWPAMPEGDAWLNRQMRHDCGLLLPDRRIGLSAHDFQQAMGAQEVWVSRAVRDDEAETVPSRWLNRLCNLISGLPDQHGPVAIDNMRNRGKYWLDQAALFETCDPVEPAKRAAPRPPSAARPRSLSVTEINRLIRDPYAIYAKHVLRLRSIDPLVQAPDAPIRGIVIHDIMDKFIESVLSDKKSLNRDYFLSLSSNVMDQAVPWPAARQFWLARLRRIADWVIETERLRLKNGTPIALEDAAKGRIDLADIGFTIHGRADRIDTDEDGNVLLYDYKSGSPPTKPQQENFDKQLLIEAAMVEEGAFEGIPAAPVTNAIYIGLGANPAEVAAPLDTEPPQVVLKKLRELLTAYLQDSQAFVARRNLEKDSHSGDFDHLARFGEWEDSDQAVPEDLT